MLIELVSVFVQLLTAFGIGVVAGQGKRTFIAKPVAKTPIDCVDGPAAGSAT